MAEQAPSRLYQQASRLHSLMLVLLNGGYGREEYDRPRRVALVDACVTEWRQ